MRPGLRNEPKSGGVLIVNADDWGRDRNTTQKMQDCVARGTVSAVSAMVFMEDSERSAEVAREQGIDTGLHLNLTMPFTSANCPPALAERQLQLVRYLKGNRLAQTVFNPRLTHQFEYVVRAQIDEYRLLYGTDPLRIDGHHHMHLCANVMFAGLLPGGTLVRRNFSFQTGEKGLLNRLYRRFLDWSLSRRHYLTDYFFSLPPLQPLARLEKICALAQNAVVEVETHPVNPAEYDFLMNDGLLRLTANVRTPNRAGFRCLELSGAKLS
jgi:hypothetical protein